MAKIKITDLVLQDVGPNPHGGAYSYFRPFTFKANGVHFDFWMWSDHAQYMQDRTHDQVKRSLETYYEMVNGNLQTIGLKNG